MTNQERQDQINKLTIQAVALRRQLKAMGNNEPGYAGVYRQWGEVCGAIEALKKQMSK